ncbi:MAG: ribosome small subunit-dependent GTPase A [Rhodospirillaceae bacterium]|nr:ribosome small subunit-dependent GTPase A [Rhodospirillaceae bacterium]
MTLLPDLATYGWSTFFQSQLSLEDLNNTRPARIIAVHRGEWDVSSPEFDGRVREPVTLSEETPVTVGDWVLLDATTHTVLRILSRHSLFQRRAAGPEAKMQLIAANVDTVFIVSSCNKDFNLARLERYLILAQEAGSTPVIVLTKADLMDDTTELRRSAERLLTGLVVECIDARDPEAVATLKPWCGVGQTVALIGSSGVGKSTIVNSIAGADIQDVGDIREDDAKGRHTTSGRTLHRLAVGGWLLDTPGMRELQMADVEDGISDFYSDIIDLAGSCKFSDCHHETEPGCAVRAAVDSGALDASRVVRYRKLKVESDFNSLSVAERRARDKSFGKRIKAVDKEMQRRQRR